MRSRSTAVILFDKRFSHECGGGGGGQGGGSPGEYRAGGVREAGEERAGSGSFKRAGSGRKMRNAIFLSSTMR